jgi:hypothetical protein
MITFWRGTIYFKIPKEINILETAKDAAFVKVF